jgi:shikimate kinase
VETVFITGPKHSGKTSAGKILAVLYPCDFFDLDDIITKQAGKSPRELYRESPDAFQKAETQSLAGLASSQSGKRVIATGGGIIDNPAAVALLKEQSALIAYLDISADSAWERIACSGELPPFLQTDNPRETHRALHDRRAAAYQLLAKIVIQADGKTPEEIADEIVNQIQFLPRTTRTNTNED